MIRKKGISLSVLAVVILVLTILATTIVTSVSNGITNVELSVWVNEITFIQDSMDENEKESESFFVQEKTFDVSNISNSILLEQFKDEIITDSKIKFYEINLSKLDLNNLVYGKHNTENDVYVYSKNTGKVYYLEGIKTRNKVYYTLLDGLRDRYVEPSETISSLSTIVFEASSITYTNKPITVTVKVPKSYTDIKITTSSNDIEVADVIEEETKNLYKVNESNYEGNYIIYVSYNDGKDDKKIEYNVNVYDKEKPTISEVRTEDIVSDEKGDYIKNIRVVDNSGVNKIKYVPTKVLEAEAEEYFKENGILVTNGKITLIEGINDYTIYALDLAGNFKILNIDISEITSEN